MCRVRTTGHFHEPNSFNFELFLMRVIDQKGWYSERILENAVYAVVCASVYSHFGWQKASLQCVFPVFLVVFKHNLLY